MSDAVYEPILQIDDAEGLPLKDFMDPRLTSRNHRAVDRGSRIQFAFDHHKK